MSRVHSALAAVLLAVTVPVLAGPAPAGAVVAPPETSCPGGSHEGCHDYGDMDAYLGHVMELVAPFFEEAYGPRSRPVATYYVGSGQWGPTSCTGPGGSPDRYDSMSFMYCAVDGSVYVGQDQLWQFYAELGDAAPAVGYAHEWGHHLQVLMGVPFPRTPAESVVFENQADCISGAWLRHADEAGQLEHPDDAQDVAALLPRIADAEDGSGDHGTLVERTAALALGYDEGLSGCSAYFPDTPVHP